MTVPTPRIAPSSPWLKVVLSGQVAAGQPWSTTDAYSMNPGPTPSLGDITGIATAMAARYKTFWLGGPTLFASASTSLLALQAFWYNAGSTSAAVNAIAAISGAVGTGSATAPLSTALVITKKTAVTTKSGRGRSYWPAVLRMSGGVFASADLSTVLVAYQTMINLFRGTPPAPLTQCNLAVVSFRTGQIHEVTSASIDTRPDRQEHRESNGVYPKTIVTIP